VHVGPWPRPALQPTLAARVRTSQGMMKTAGGARIAEGRHAFMEQYLQQFHEEWSGRA
jgi:hypothetical protein